MLLTLSGPATVGKDSIWLRAAECIGYVREVPFTTRTQRENEHDGVDYHFVSRDIFYEMVRKGDLLDWDFTLGHYYGMHVSLGTRILNDENVSLQVLSRMALRLRTKLKRIVTVLLLPSDPLTIEHRLTERGYVGTDLLFRSAHGHEEQYHAPLFDFVIPGADITTLEDAIRTLSDIVNP